jgi:hypothetical protein
MLTSPGTVRCLVSFLGERIFAQVRPLSAIPKIAIACDGIGAIKQGKAAHQVLIVFHHKPGVATIELRARSSGG